MPGRIRTIKPEFFLSESLGELSPLHRLLFAGLWCYADREGRLEDRPKYLKTLILPWDRADVDQMLTDLHDHPDQFIIRYMVDGKRFIQIVHFVEHQRPNSREAKSEIPACTDSQDGNARTRMHVQEREEGNGEWEGKGREGEKGTPDGASLSLADWYEIHFRPAYPKRTHRPQVLEALRKLKPDEALRDRLLRAISARKEWAESAARRKRAGEDCFLSDWPDPHRWVNHKRWEDEAPDWYTDGPPYRPDPSGTPARRDPGPIDHEALERALRQRRADPRFFASQQEPEDAA